MKKLLDDVPDYIKELIPYPPGKPLEELEREYGITDSIKLASNENDMGPSPRALEVLKQSTLNRIFRYPDGSCFYLKNALCKKLKVDPDNIVLGNGSNELIDFLARVFIRAGRNAITSRPSFLVYTKMVQIAGGENRVVPLKNDTHDLTSIAKAVDNYTRLIFLDNPNNPMGTVIKRGDFTNFLKDLPEHLLVILDEAYGEFVRPGTDWAEGSDFVQVDKRIVVLRTFSKAYGLAGLRIGYGIMDERIAALLNRVRQPFNVNIAAQDAAIEAVNDEEHLKRTLENNWKEMDRIKMALEKMGCKVKPSHTNFILIDTGKDSKKIYEAMLRQGVIIRSMASYGFDSCVRLTIGTPEENDRFLMAFQKTLEQT